MCDNGHRFAFLRRCYLAVLWSAWGTVQKPEPGFVFVLEEGRVSHEIMMAEVGHPGRERPGWISGKVMKDPGSLPVQVLLHLFVVSDP